MLDQRKLALLFAVCLPLFAVLGFTQTLAVEPNPRVKELQQGLAELGYHHRPADGLMGPGTREAIIAFQKDHDLVADGKYSGILLLRLKIALETPEDRNEKNEREGLLTMTNDRLIALIERADGQEVERLVNLLGERASELPLQVLSQKTDSASTSKFLASFWLKGLYYSGH